MNIYRLMSIIAFVLMTTLHADFFSGAWNDIKKAAHTTGDAFETAGQAIGDRFKNTKLTRSVDYAVRKAAFEASLHTALGILDATQTISAQTLVTAEKSATLGLKAAEGFLTEIVKRASPALLETSAKAANGVLDGARISGVGILKGTEWVATNTIGQFDLNRIRYQGDLKGLEGGVVGSVLCEGKLLGKDFRMNIRLDPRDVGKSIKPLLDTVGTELQKNVFNPLRDGINTINNNISSISKIGTDLSAAQRPAAIEAALAASQEAQRTLKKFEDEEKAAIEQLIPEAKKLNDIAMLSSQELTKLIQQQGTRAGYSGVAARQELARRARSNK